MKIMEMFTVTEISIVIITIAFVILVIVLSITSIKAKRAFQATQIDVHRVSLEVCGLIAKIGELSTDIQSKSDAFFDSIVKIQPDSTDTHPEQQHVVPKMPFKVIGWILSSMLFLRKTKQFIRRVL